MDETVKDKRIEEKELYGTLSDTTVVFADKLGEYLAEDSATGKKLTTSQLRKFFGEVKRQQISGYNKTDFVMLKPKLAYAVGRAKKSAKNEPVKIEDFYKIITDAIDKVEKCDEVNQKQAFVNFIKFFEAIVAYHKKYVKE